MAATSYLIGIGSNRRHGRHGGPERVVTAAVAAMAAAGLAIEGTAPTLRSAALGPAGRRFANAAALLRAPLDPPALLTLLKRIERDFGRRRGRRWGARVLDLDILAWERGAWQDARLTIPHAGLRDRRFALAPAAVLAPAWRIGGITLRQAAARLARRRPRDRAPVDRRRSSP